jgi:hypothetical protein
MQKTTQSSATKKEEDPEQDAANEMKTLMEQEKERRL